MARAFWSGAVSFGLVNVPVKAYSAIRDHDVHFHQLEKKTGARIRYEKVSDKSGQEVAGDEIELGYEIERGKYVTIDPGQLDEMRPRTTRTIDVSAFVALEEIDPIYYQRTYWLAPDGEAAVRPYRLLLAAMQDRGRVGVGQVVMRNKQYLAAIRPIDGALAMSTMRFADEIVPRTNVDAIPRKSGRAEPKELKLATMLIDSLATDWDPETFRDTYTEELRDLLKRKAKGEEVVVEPPAAAKSNVVDLMAALEASIDAAKKAKGGNAARELAKAADRLQLEAEAAVANEEPAPRRRGSGGRKATATHKAPVKSTTSEAKARKSA